MTITFGDRTAEVLGGGTGTAPSVNDAYFDGGMRVVANLTELNAIPTENRKAGMLVNVLSAYGGGQTIFQLDAGLTTWSVAPLLQSTADVTLYVAHATGSDSNDGSVGSPFATIGRALRVGVQKLQSNTVTINVARGTYAESLVLNEFSDTTPASSITSGVTPSVIIQGTDWDAVTPATGPSTGTFDSVTGNFANLSTATWTGDNLRGKFLYITAAPSAPSLVGKYLPVVTNTATGIELPWTQTGTNNLNGATFQIVTHAVILTNNAAGSYSVFNGNTVGLQLKSIRIAPATGASINAVYQLGAARINLESCYVVGRGSNASIFVGDSVSTTVTYCYITSASGHCCQIDVARNIIFTGSVFRPGLTSKNGAVISTSGQFSTSIGCMFELANIGLTVNRIPIATLYGSTVRNCTTGISAAQDGLLVSTCTITLNTVGMLLRGDLQTPIMVHLANTAITSNGTGIQLGASGAVIYGEGASTNIANNTTYGVDLAADIFLGAKGGMNTFSVSSAVTMSGNTTADINLGDATGGVSIANVRAAPQKTIVDPTRLNRAASL